MRLQTIYEAIQSHSYKEAFHLCNKALKKDSSSQILLALKAVALSNLQKYEEAISIVTSLAERDVRDPDVVAFCTDVLHDHGLDSEVVNMYEKASKHLQCDEQFHKDWFNDMVKKHNSVGQQKAALALSKRFENRDYFFRAVSSNLVLHNVKRDQTNEPPDKLLYGILAYRMMGKAAEEGRIQTAEELHLYIESILVQKNYEEALTVLQGRLGQKFKEDVDLQMLQLDLLNKCDKWEELYFVARNLLKEGRDDWAYYDAIVNCSGPLMKAQTEELGQDRIKAELGGIWETRHDRNSGLARVKFAWKYVPEELLLMCCEYFRVFCGKACCYEDLQTYVEALSPRDATSFIHYVRDEVFAMSEEADGQMEQIKATLAFTNQQKFIYMLKLSEHKDRDLLQDFSRECLERYVQALALGIDLDETENNYGDDLLILAAHSYLQCDRSCQQRQLAVAVMLEHALQKSRYNFKVRLLLLRMYLLLGAGSEMLRVYKDLSVKQVQKDTVSHYALSRASTLWPSKAMYEEIEKAAHIYHSNEEETPEMIILAYSNRIYSQIHGFVEFRKRLNDSMWRVALAIEEDEIGARLGRSTVRHERTPHSLSDNRDFNIFLNCKASKHRTWEEETRPGPLIGSSWVQAVRALLDTTTKGLSDAKVERQFAILERLLQPESAEAAKFTQDEMWRASAVLKISKMLHIARKGDNIHDEAGDLHSWIDTWSPLSFFSRMDWQFLHSANTVKALDRTLEQFYESFNMLSKPTREATESTIEYLQRAMENRKAQALWNAECLRSNLRDAVKVQKSIADVNMVFEQDFNLEVTLEIGVRTNSKVPRGFIQRTIGNIAKSQVEALECIIK